MKYQNHIQHYQTDANFYNYFENNPIEEHNIKRRYACLFKWLSPLKKGILLEIGSGGGYAVKEIDKTFFDYIALDIPITNLKGIKFKSKKQIYPVSGDAYKLPFKENSINVIILSEVLEHLEDPAAALKEMSRILDQNGVLLISVPYKEKISYQICVHCNRPTPTHAHFHSFDEKVLMNFSDKNNMVVERYKKVNNKIMSRMSIILKLHRLPLGLWNIFDTIINIVIPKPSYILIQLKKLSPGSK